MDLDNKLNFAWLRTQLVRPWLLLFQEPIVFAISIYMAIVYVGAENRSNSAIAKMLPLQGTLYMLFAAFPIVRDLLAFRFCLLTSLRYSPDLSARQGLECWHQRSRIYGHVCGNAHWVAVEPVHLGASLRKNCRKA